MLGGCCLIKLKDVKSLCRCYAMVFGVLAFAQAKEIK